MLTAQNVLILSKVDTGDPYLSLSGANVNARDRNEDGDLQVVELLLHREQPLSDELGPPRRVGRLHRKRPQVLKKREREDFRGGHRRSCS